MSQWSDDRFLDGLRARTDALADRAVRRLIDEHGVEAVNRIFPSLTADDQPLPADAPPALQEFSAATAALPPGADLARIERAEKVFMEHPFTASLVLLAKSLPEGYAAPNLARILTISRDLETNPYRRLLGVLQMLVNVCSSHGFGPAGKALVTARKLRLLHAGVRTLVPRYRPDYAARFGPPVNLEDMLATIMGFSYLVIAGLRLLRVELSDAEAEDYYYLWHIFAQLMGIHPEAAPESAGYVPQSVAEAGEFYAAYARRHYVGPEANPEGPVLARDNLELMRDLLPRGLRLVSGSFIPRYYLGLLLGDDGCARVGIKPAHGDWLLRLLLSSVPGLIHRPAEKVPEPLVEQVGRLAFQGMINRAWNDEVTFLVPDSLAALRRLS
jgi:hypothetical protein